MFNYKQETSRKTIEHYDQIAAGFAAQNFEIAMLEQKQEFIKLLQPQAKLLDLGCGPGRDTLFFRQQGYQVVGLDLSAGMLEEALKRVPGGNFVQADMCQLPFHNSTFDGLWVCASLLSLPKAQATVALSEMNRVLRQGGALFIGVKRGNGEKWEPSPIRPDLQAYFSFYQPYEIEKLVSLAGFEVLKITENQVNNRFDTDGHPISWINLYARHS